jgi:hypothetical protein
VERTAPATKDELLEIEDAAENIDSIYHGSYRNEYIASA